MGSIKSLAIDSTPSPSALPRGQGGGMRVPTSNHLVSFPGNQPLSLGAFQKSLGWLNLGVVDQSLLWISRYLYWSFRLGNFKRFRNSVPGMEMKVKYISIINHNITVKSLIGRWDFKQVLSSILLAKLTWQSNSLSSWTFSVVEFGFRH